MQLQASTHLNAHFSHQQNRVTGRQKARLAHIDKCHLPD